jgi:hypothetical protein
MLDEEGNPVYVYETVKNADGTDMLDEEGNPVYVTEYDETINEDVPVRKKVVKDIDDAAWVLKADGSGHLANGKISWDSEGQLNVSGNIGQVNGDKIGPWTLVEEADGKKYITDEERINTFGSDGSFVIGGNNGISKNESNIQFGNSNNGFSIDTNGNLTFGSGVTLSWNNVTDNNNVATKSDIPSLDDYVTEEQLRGTLFTEIGDNWIKTANVICKELDTLPDANIDKINIKDNTIKCVTENGDINLKISSNPINSDFIDSLSEGNMVDETVNSITPAAQPPTVFSNVGNNLKTVNAGSSMIKYRTNKEAHYSGNNNMINTDGDDLYCNRIGFVYGNSKLDIEVAVGIYNISSPSAYNANTSKLLLTNKASYEYSDTGSIINNPGSYSGAKLPKWTIFGSNNITPGWGRPAASTYVVGGNTGGNAGTTTFSGGHLLIYKYDNESNDYFSYKSYNFTNAWTDRLEPFKEPNTSNLLDWKYNTISDIIIEDDGIYAIEVCFEPNSIGVVDMSTSDEVTYCVVCPFKTHIQQALPNDFVEIGKDGIIVYNKKNTLSVGKGDVIISSKILDANGYDTFNFIGIKLNDEGIYLGTGSNNWEKLNIAKMKELGILGEE